MRDLRSHNPEQSAPTAGFLGKDIIISHGNSLILKQRRDIVSGEVYRLFNLHFVKLRNRDAIPVQE